MSSWEWIDRILDGLLEGDNGRADARRFDHLAEWVGLTKYDYDEVDRFLIDLETIGA